MCGCGSKRSGAPVQWRVKMPDGTIKTYSSDIAAKAKAAATPGAILYAPDGSPSVSV